MTVLMTPEERIATLQRGEWQPDRYYIETLVITPPQWETIKEYLIRWGRRFLGESTEIVRENQDGSTLTSRVELNHAVFYSSAFHQHITIREAAIDWGIDVPSMQRVVNRFEETIGRCDWNGLPIREFENPCHWFPSFGDFAHLRDSKERSFELPKLHRALRREGIEVKPVFDKHGELLHDEQCPPYQLDAITLEPCGRAREDLVWLDFGCGLSVHDIVSIVTWVRYCHLLEQFTPRKPSKKIIDLVQSKLEGVSQLRLFD